MKSRDVFENFIENNLDSCFRFAYTYVKNKEAAEDIVSDSVLKALKSIHALKDGAKVKPWFFRIIANTALNDIRSRKKFTSLDEAAMSAVNHKEDDYSRVTLESMFECLPVKLYEVVTLRYLEDMTIPEISQVTGVNENTVKSRLYRALDMLKKNL